MADRPQRILVFGGTFDPPHRAHVELPPLIARQLGCELIIYVPAAANPLKAEEPTAAHHRLAMLQLALRDVPMAEISTIELERPGPSYTIDTLEELRRRLGPAAELRLLIGADQALDFHRWKDWDRIIELAPPAVMLRPPWNAQTLAEELRSRLGPREAEQWRGWLMEAPVIPASGTDVRERQRAGEAVRDPLDPAVAAYIREHSLYRT
jgi:nicotinate-nucleotide adenylyltransferase